MRVLAIILLVAAALAGLVVLRARSRAAPAADVHPLMQIPVPWVYVLVFLAGVGVQQVVPIRIESPGARRTSISVGVVLTLAGMFLAFSGLGIFKKAGTTTVPFETAKTLVTWGPYRFTRNPMYLGLSLVYLGVAGTNVQLWPVVLLPLVLTYVHAVVIPVEESRLREVFGPAYAQYCAKVRRWV
jgi:protein-S-isoprenylcysteine O-methyltransferase Ste14